MASSEKKAKPKKDPVKEYGRVVDAADLEAVTLVSMQFDARPDYYSHKKDVSLGYSIDVSDQKYDTKNGKAFAFIDCGVEGVLGDEVTLSFAGRYIVAYGLSEKCDKEAVETFLRRVAVFACYPYFRAIVANIDWAAATGIPPMPVHKERKAPKTDDVELLEAE